MATARRLSTWTIAMAIIIQIACTNRPAHLFEKPSPPGYGGCSRSSKNLYGSFMSAMLFLQSALDGANPPRRSSVAEAIRFVGRCCAADGDERSAQATVRCFRGKQRNQRRKYPVRVTAAWIDANRHYKSGDIGVQFVSSQILQASGQGQSHLAPPSGGNITGSITFSIPGGGFTDYIFNPQVGGGAVGGTATITAVANDGMFTQGITLGNGQNFWTVTAGGTEFLTSVELTVGTGNYNQYQQPRVSGVCTIGRLFHAGPAERSGAGQLDAPRKCARGLRRDPTATEVDVNSADTCWPVRRRDLWIAPISRCGVRECFWL